MAFEYLRKTYFDDEAKNLLDSMMTHFGRINDRLDLPDEDKKRLKEYYLEHLMRPKCKGLLERFFPEDFGGKAPTSIYEIEAMLGEPPSKPAGQRPGNKQ